MKPIFNNNSTPGGILNAMSKFTKKLIYNSNKIALIAVVIFLATSIYILFLSENTSDKNIQKKVSSIEQYNSAVKLDKTGDSLFKLSEHRSAINYYKQAVDLYNGDTLNKKKAATYRMMGMCFFETSQNAEALKAYFDGLEILKDQDKKLSADLNFQISRVYRKKGLFKDAEKKLAIATNFYATDPIKYNKSLAKSYLDKAAIYQMSDRSELSLTPLLEAKAVLADTTTLDYAGILNNIGIYYLIQNNMEKGLSYLGQAAEISFKFKDSTAISSYYSNLAEAALSKNDYNSAIEKMKKAMAFIPSTKNNNIQYMYKANYANLAEIYAAINDFKNANLYNKTLVHFLDSLYSLKAIKYIADIENDYRIRSKNNELKEAELKKQVLQSDIENKQKQKYLLFTLLLLTFIAGLYIYKLLSTRVIKSELKEELLEKNNLILENEKKLIESDKLLLEKDNLILENQNELLEKDKQLLGQENELLEKDKILLENEKQLIENDKALLNNELDKIKKELEFNVNIIDQKEALIHNLEDQILKTIPKELDHQEIASIINSIKEGLAKEKENIGTEIMLNETNIQFFRKLKDKHPGLSKTEIRLSTLLYLNLETKELARIMNISIEGVRKGKHRLRKKMELDTASDISSYLQTI